MVSSNGRSLSENSRPGPQKTRRRWRGLSFRCAKHKDTVSAVDIIEFWLHLPIEMSWNVFELKRLRPKRNIGMSPHHQRADLRSWNWEGRVLCCAVPTAIHSLSCRGEVTQKMPSQAKHKLLLWSECHVNYLSARVCRRRSTPQCHHSSESNQDIHLRDFLRLHNLLRHNIFSQLLLKPSLGNFSISCCRASVRTVVEMLLIVRDVAETIPNSRSRSFRPDLEWSWMILRVCFLPLEISASWSSYILAPFSGKPEYSTCRAGCRSYWRDTSNSRRTKLTSSTRFDNIYCADSAKLYAAGWSPTGCRCLCPGFALILVRVLWSCGAIGSFSCLPWLSSQVAMGMGLPLEMQVAHLPLED